MTTSEISCADSIQHAHLVMSRDKQAMTVLVKDGLVIEAILCNDIVLLTTYSLFSSVPIGCVPLSLIAFDEILEMVIGFGRA